MSQVKRESFNDNDDDIRSIEGSEWTLETASIATTIEDGNAQGNESNSINALLETKEQLKKLKKAEDKAKSIIQAIQEKVDESAQEMATRNAEHQKRQRELDEKYRKESAELESKKMEENANFAKEMIILKEQLKEKINWNQVDLVMNEKLRNPISNRWNAAQTKNNSISISADGLNANNSNSNTPKWQSISAEKGFIISMDLSGPVLFYFEVTNLSFYKGYILVGLSTLSGNIPAPADGSHIGYLPNSYAIHHGYDHYFVSGKKNKFKCPNGAITPEWNGNGGDVLGCGLLLNTEKKLSLFFTANGILMGKQIPIDAATNPLYPFVSMFGAVSVEANFGNDSANPFKYDTKKCPGMVFK